MSTPTCRSCMHSVWVLSPRGQIKRQTAGVCTMQTALASMSMRAVRSPCIETLTINRPIWPTTKAGQCPGFVRKAPNKEQN